MNEKPPSSMDPAEAMFLALLEEHSIINKTIEPKNSKVQKFYEDAVVLVTGASGFLGKQLIEKLLRSCNIQKIYLLLRPKKQKTLEERVQYMLRDELYDYLREHQPDFVSKLIPIAGDITENRLGLSESNWNILTEEVNVILHVAATVNFLEPLKVATLTNVRGTREMLKLAKACKNLKSFVHVSTAYAHATSDRVKQTVLEQFYESPISPEILIELAEQLDEGRMNQIAAQLLGSWPNTYAYTKAVAEEVVRTMGDDLPICIVRPAIVIQAYCEPPGWADRSTMNTSVIGFIVGVCIGGLHVLFSRRETYMDVVPVDLVNNAVIAAAQRTAAMRASGDTDCKIYTVSRRRNPIQLNDLIGILEYSKEVRDLVPPQMVWYGYGILTDNKFVFVVLSWLLHFIPGYLVDAILVLCGKRAKVIKLFDRAYKQNKVYGFYLCNDWKFEDSNLVQMIQDFSPTEKIIFNCDTATFEQKQYTINSALGCRKYILKDGLQHTLYARRKLFWLGILNVIYLILYAYAIWKLFWLLCGMSRFVLRSIWK